MNRPDSTPLEHKATAPRSIGCWVLTVSDTKTPETDTSGEVIRRLLLEAGHRVIGSAIVRDEPKDVQRVIREACANDEVGAVIATGGTGITSRDSTYEAIEVLLQVMEAERQNLVVVMAGYKEPMEEFFRANPGMGSRVVHHIGFPDYDADELMQIGRLMVGQQGYELSGAAVAMVPSVFR